MRRLLIFLLVMTLAVTVHNIPVPGDCTTSPYTQNGGIQDGRLHLDCTLSAINSEYEKTNFSVIPGDHTASLTVRCLDSISRSYLEPQGIYLSIYQLTIYLSIHISIYKCILTFYISIYLVLQFYQYIYPSIYLYLQYFYLSLYLFI